MRKPTYWLRLKHHPVWPPALVLTMLGAFTGGVAGAIALSIFWIPVLITARTQPVPSKELRK